jgi:hypothetical protein
MEMLIRNGCFRNFHDLKEVDPSGLTASSEAAAQPPKPFRLPDKFWEPTPLQAHMCGPWGVPMGKTGPLESRGLPGSRGLYHPET